MTSKDALETFARLWPNDMKRIELLGFLSTSGKALSLRDLTEGLKKSPDETASILFPAIKDGLVELKATSDGEECAAITPLGVKVLQSVQKS